MLAYVFWHWSKPDVAPADYEQYQRDFHAALARSAPRGFLNSAAFRIEGQAAWLGGAPAYADWYLVQDSAALDPLNVAAVSGVCEVPHTTVAQAMAAGAGSLFALRDEAPAPVPPNLPAAQTLTFLTKPREMPYATFYATVAALPNNSNATLWRRTMVLGPTPEFALLTPAAPPLPPELHPLALTISAI
jgi:hypothetical protein